MCSATRDDELLDGRVTSMAGLTLSSVNPMARLKPPRGIFGIPVVADAGATCGDGFVQYSPEGPEKAADGVGRQVGSTGRRMDSGPVESLIAVDVAHAADRLLIEQQRFDLPSSAEQAAPRWKRDLEGVSRHRGKSPADPRFYFRGV